MRAAVDLEKHSFLRHPVAALTMLGWTASMRWLRSRLPADTFDALATEDDALSLGQELGEVMVVAAGVGTGHQVSYPRADRLADPAR